MASGEAMGARLRGLQHGASRLLSRGKSTNGHDPGQNLGLAIVTTMPARGFLNDAHNRLVKLTATELQIGNAMAAWDQEGSNRLEKIGPETKRIPSFNRASLRWHSNERRICFLCENAGCAHENQCKCNSYPLLRQRNQLQQTQTFRTQPNNERGDFVASKGIDRTAAQWSRCLRSSAAIPSAQKMDLDFHRRERPDR